MRALRIHVYNPIDRAIPNGLSLYMLGLGLLAAGVGQIIIAAVVYYGYRLEAGLSLAALTLANGALTAVAIVNLLRRSSSLAALMRGDSPPTFAVRFIHLAVAAHAAIALAFLLPLLETLLSAYTLGWMSLSGAALILALLNRLRWNPRLALLGAVISISVFGCAVWYAPSIYGWDLRPLGWHPILATAIPVLAFLILFLRRYSPVFSASRRRRFGLAAALFAALICALAAQMSANPADRFGGELRAALASGADEIRFSELTDFEWDAVEIYIPYTFNESLSPAAREGTDIVSRSHLGFNSAIDFVVFMKDGEAVYGEIIRRDNYKFKYWSERPHPWSVPLEDAVFKVERDSDGYRILAIAD